MRGAGRPGSPGPAPFAVLFRHFVGRFVRHERLRVEEGAEARWIGMAAVLACLPAAVFFQIVRVHVVYGPGREGAWSLQCLFLAVAMSVAAVLSLLQWDAILPDETDRALLLALPLRRRTLLAAKAASLLAFVALFSAALASLSALVFGVYLADPAGGLSAVLRLAAAHAASVFAADLAVYLCLGTLQGVFLLLLPPRAYRLASGGLQAGLVALVLAAFPWLPEAAARLQSWKAGGAAALSLFPPAWFAGGFAVLAGEGDAAFRRLASIGALALALLSLLFGLVLGAGWSRRLLQWSEAGGGRGAAARPARRNLIDALLLRHAHERAACRFVWATLRRSPRHRLIVGAYLAAGLGFVFIDQASAQPDDWLIAPILGFCAVLGLRVAIVQPLQDRAAWLVRVTEPEDKRYLLRGVAKALWLGLLLPLHLAVLALVWARGATPAPAGHAALHLALSTLLLAALVGRLAKFPFACAPLPGKIPTSVAWLLFLTALWLYTLAAEALERLASGRGPAYAALAALLGAAVWALAAWRVRTGRTRFPFVHEDLPPDRLLLLDLPPRVAGGS